MPIVGGGIALGGGLVGAIGGSLAAAPYNDAANAAQQAALQKWLSVNVPSVEQQQVELQRYASTGQLSPQLQTAFDQSPSNLKNMQIDPASRAAEMQALTRMQDISKSGGMDAQALQQEQQAINAANANEAGQRGAITQNFAARGMGGSGAELAAKLLASQGDANQAASGGLQAAAGGEQRALQAMTQSGALAGSLNAQDYTQASNAAAAQDAINQFNTRNKQAVENSNVTAQNQAQAGNLANAQDIANRNVGVANTQEEHNKGLYQQNYEDQLQQANGLAGAYGGISKLNQTQAGEAADQWSGIGSAIAQGGAAYGSYKNNQSKNNQSDDQSDDEEK